MSAAGNQNLFLSLFYDQALFMIKGILLLFSIDFPGKNQIALGKTPSPCNVGKKRNFPVQNPVSPDHFHLRQIGDPSVNANISFSVIKIPCGFLLHIDSCMTILFCKCKNPA